ncbi:hypothetical protein CAC42_4287 [Sphaceloma murrayae]|uniref:Alpha-L-rhamnosidase six-hairpin glycosidase domain-containing protein n=1 Tax=Sphaceloma murrayae TaxID=2082308 RepID=A0A2K1QKZ9_9PEZI|nr:hypothetical protein CAC42_4287 [Sphaceloma murrayae]
MLWKSGVFSALLTAAGAAKYEEYILAPSSRTLHPVSIWQGKINGTVLGAESIAGDGPGSATFQDTSAVTYDFGKNIAGLVTLQIGATDPDQFIGFTYSESSLWISGEGSDATQDSGIDEIIGFYPTGPGTYTVSREHERGGFRYLSLIHNTTGSTEVEQITVYYTATPHFAEDQLRNYTGYFNCDDELLNRVWYAGAYTNQMCTIDPHHGNSLVHLGKVNSSTPGDTVPPWTWYNNYTLFNGSAALSDGSKRDRLVWPGDLIVSTPSMFVSTNDMNTVRESMDSLFAIQNMTTGQLPYAGDPFQLLIGPIYSPTYHMYNLIDIYDYYLYTQDLPYLQSKWEAWKLGLNFSLGFIDETGLFNATGEADWLRFGMGGHNIEANAILYYTLATAMKLGSVLNDTGDMARWQNASAYIKRGANELLWNATAGMYRDNETTTLMPQDGNAWAVIANITETPEQALQVSQGLRARWTPYGAPAPEASTAISPYIGGYEIQTHTLAGNLSASLELIRIEWGFMLDDPRMTNSTFIEGYRNDGELKYAPYSNDPRISHSHGWATGPTSYLTFYVAGLQIVTAAGQTWRVAPQLGDLRRVDAGYQTPLGNFAAQTNVTEHGGLRSDFSTPQGTQGSFVLPYPACSGVMTLTRQGEAEPCVTVAVVGRSSPSGNIEIADIDGGAYRMVFECQT